MTASTVMVAVALVACGGSDSSSSTTSESVDKARITALFRQMKERHAAVGACADAYRAADGRETLERRAEECIEENVREIERLFRKMGSAAPQFESFVQEVIEQARTSSSP